MNGTAPNPISQALAAAIVARRLANRGDVHLAIGLLCQALRMAPEAPLVESAESWLTVENLRSLDVRPLRRLALTMARLAAEQPSRSSTSLRASQTSSAPVAAANAAVTRARLTLAGSPTSAEITSTAASTSSATPSTATSPAARRTGRGAPPSSGTPALYPAALGVEGGRPGSA